MNNNNNNSNNLGSDAKQHINHHHRHSWHGSTTTTNVTSDNSPVDHNSLSGGNVNKSELPTVTTNTNTMQARAEQQSVKSPDEKKKASRYSHGRSGSLGRLMSVFSNINGSESASHTTTSSSSSSSQSLTSAASLASSPRSLSMSSLMKMKSGNNKCVGAGQAGMSSSSGVGFATRLGLAFDHSARVIQSKKNVTSKRRLGFITVFFTVLGFTLLVFLIVLLHQTKGPRIDIVTDSSGDEDMLLDYHHIGYSSKSLSFGTVRNSNKNDEHMRRANYYYTPQENVERVADMTSMRSYDGKKRPKFLDVSEMYFGTWEGSLSNATLPPWPPQKHRVAIFTGAYSHIVDGVSLTLNRLVRFLEEQGNEVLVVAPTLPNGESAVPNPAGKILPTLSISVPFRPEYRGSLPLTPSMKRKLNEFAPTIAHIATPDVLGLDAMRWVHSYNTQHHLSSDTNDRSDKAMVPIVCSYHTRFNAYLKYYGLKMAEGVLWTYLRSFYNGCQHVYPPTPSVGNELIEHGIRRDAVRLWPRGVNITLFTPEKKNQDFRDKILDGSGVGITERANGEVIMLMVSRLVLEKGLNVFADVVDLVIKNNLENIKVVVVGEGPARAALEKRFEAAMRSREGSLYKKPQVTFLGALTGEKLATIYASCDFFLFPSLTEGWGNVALEAMASGLPVIGAEATGTTFLIRDGETGFLARPDDAQGMFKFVKALSENTEVLQKMSQTSREWAVTFTWSRAFSLLMKHYEEALVMSSAS